MIWTVEKLWDDATCVILAGGPSLEGFDVSQLDGLRVITINDSWRMYPTADVFYFCDSEWWKEQWAFNRAAIHVPDYNFRQLVQDGFWVKGGEEQGDFPDSVRVVGFTGQVGLETDPAGLKHGSNSGYQAINLAYHLGATNILLLGYDMRCQGATSHWHDGPRLPAGYFQTVLQSHMLPLFPTLVEPLRQHGIQVLNCTPGSALECFPMRDFQECAAEFADNVLTTGGAR